MRSTRRLTKILPCNQARALAGSFLGRWPKPRIDFMRLNANSICQRSLYSSSTASAEKVVGKVVHTAKYCAASQDSRLTFFCDLLALRSKRRRAMRVACALRLTAIRRPGLQPPSDVSPARATPAFVPLSTSETNPARSDEFPRYQIRVATAGSNAPRCPLGL